MFRRSPLPRTCLIVALGLAAFTRPAPAWSQDSSTQERLDRLERDLNMLQRQVYRGGSPRSTAGGDGGGAVNTEIRMDRLEAQMRDLTGRVEEAVNRVDQVRQRVEQINGDIETRFSQGGTVAGPLAAANPRATAPPPRPAAPTGAGLRFPTPPPDANDEEPPPAYGAAGASAMPAGTVVPPPEDAAANKAAAPSTAGPTPIFGTLKPPGSTPRRDLASAAPAARPAAGGPLPGGSATEQYNHAFGLVKQANYPAAEAALKAFVEQHPQDSMAGSAQYWLGETYYTRGRYMEAASAFAEGYKRYPKSAKAADDLLKLGMSLGHANQKQNACLALAQLDHDFPHPAAAIREHAAAEKKRLGC